MTEVKKTYVRGFHSVMLEYDLHDSEPATVDLVCMLVNFLRPEIIVEAGTYRGRMAASVANTIRAYGGTGVIYTADPVDRVTDLFRMEELEGIRPHVRYFEGDYLEMLGGIKGEVDLAYIDASHVDNPHMRWEHAMATYLRLRYGGLILVDDTSVDAEWDDAEKFRSIANVYLPLHRGLTIIQKRQPWL